MYIRSNGKNYSSRDIEVPQNYRGNAFSEVETQEIIEEEESSEENKKIDLPVSSDNKRGSLSFLSNDEDIILLGLILLLAQEELASEILPILIIILFLSK